MKTIAFFNNKGGVGKTSLVYHLAWMYAELGHSVIAADLDPQANLTSQWPDCLDRKPRAFRVISAIWRIIETAARDRKADLVLIDVGPNLGALGGHAQAVQDCYRDFEALARAVLERCERP